VLIDVILKCELPNHKLRLKFTKIDMGTVIKSVF